MNTGDLTRAGEVLSGDLLDAFSQRVTLARAALPYLEMTVEELVAEETLQSDRAGRDRWTVVARVTASGTHKGAYLGIPATDKRQSTYPFVTGTSLIGITCVVQEKKAGRLQAKRLRSSSMTRPTATASSK